MSFTKGLNGLTAAAKNLEIIGNNVANANTIGYKAGQAYFAEVFANSQGASLDKSGSASGAATTRVIPQFTQGSFSVTNNPLDLAINGEGLFQLKDEGSTIYSRAGQFTVDKAGYITNPSGARLQGYLGKSAGASGMATTVDLKIDATDTPPSATTKAAVNVNLDSRTATLDPAGFRATDPATYHSATSMPVYDDIGTQHTLSFYFVKTADAKYSVFASSDGAQIGSGPVGTLGFKANGTVDPATSTQPFALTVPVTKGANAMAINADFGSTTSVARAFSVSSVAPDGNASGQLSGYNVGGDGTITGRYSNGETRTLGQVALALFNNTQGLRPLGSNGFSETAESGAARLGTAGSGMFGTLQSGSLEQSNVDLTQELVRMVEAQRVYQANAQAIKAEDTILQSATNLR
jgi:flagellar hook protein FlgE